MANQLPEDPTPGDVPVPSRRERLGVASAAVLGWLPVAVFWIYSKQIRIHDKYFPLVRAYSNVEAPGTWFDHLSIFRPDILLCLLLIPTVIFVSHYISPRSRFIRWTWILTAVAVTVLLFANLHSWGTIGRFLTGTAIVNAISFAAEQPNIIGSYIGFRSLGKLVAILSASLLCFIVLTRFWRVRWQVIVTTFMSSVLLIGAVSAWGASFRSTLLPLPVTRDFVWQAIESLADFSSSARKKAPEVFDMKKSFSALVENPDAIASPYYGTAAGNDLLVFVLETGSSRFIDLKGDLDSFQTLKRLAARSVLAQAHHAVFPATAESLFSFYTSTYPTRTLYGTCVVSPDSVISKPFDGFFSALKARGYYTSAYLPWTSVVPLDKAILANIGLENIYYAQQHKPRPEGRDVMALEALKSDISRLNAENKRYAMVFLPQIGHAPWTDRPDDRSIKSHGKSIVQIQDQWLGQIVNILEKSGRLEKTTIVVTGDHGIRTTNEDPDFNSGLIDRYSFEVPLLIHSPSSFNSTKTINTRTSHIDVSPTLLDLYGIQSFPNQQGLQIFQPNIEKRRQFFEANWYFGSDGFVDSSGYFMYSEVLGLAFESKALQFTPQQVIHAGEKATKVRRQIDDLYDLQEEWIRKNLCR